ncbi:MAG: sulfatase-like hydrolase/transferase [Gammaproteobacteria bacterium]|nr:sulfatase-like hydrolase/transferase [Gammaproteobacteria bacterium]
MLTLTTIRQSRYFVIAIIFAVAMVTFATTRTILAVLAPDQAELSIGSLLETYGIGALYDIAFFAYALIPVSLYLLLMPNRLWRSRINKAWVHLACFATIYGLLFIVVAEILFWLEFQVRFNFISVDYLVYRREVTDNIVQSYPVALILTGIFLLTALIYWRLAIHVQYALNRQESFRRRALVGLALLLLPMGAYAGLDQRLMHFSQNAYQNELACDGPYQFFAAFRNNELDYRRFYTTIDDELASSTLRREVQEPNSAFVDDDLYDIRRRISAEGEEQRLNIMLVMIESLSAKYLGIFGNEAGLTPNLDKLADSALLFSRFYATGTRTTRGLEAVTLSIPPTPGRSIVKRLGHESRMWSLGNVLKSKGYDTRYIYGGRGYFDNMNAFFSGNGYQVVDQSSVADEELGFTNAWGMADEDLYTQAIKLADDDYERRKTFFFHLMTTSNHRPYTYPDDRIDIPSGDGRYGAVKYTDWAIGDFLARVKEKPWFDDTLFVFVADHTAGSAGKTALPVRGYHIPMLIYSPAHLAPQRIDKLASQIDLAPTLLGMLNMSYESSAFGKDILRMTAKDERALIGNYQHLGLYTPGLLSVISPRRQLSQQRDPESPDADMTEADAEDPLMRRDLAYYQGADYIYQHRMNTWDNHDGSIKADSVAR